MWSNVLILTFANYLATETSLIYLQLGLPGYLFLFSLLLIKYNFTLVVIVAVSD